MKKNLLIAFKYSCLYFLVVVIRSIYLMTTYNPVVNRFFHPKLTFEILVVFYYPIIAFFICLAISHRSYIKQNPKHYFKNILVISILFAIITYCLTYVSGYFEYHLFYKKHELPKKNTGILGLLDSMNSHEPNFSPFNQLIWYPIQNVMYYFKQGRVWAFLHEITISKIGMISIAIYYEALYLLFRKYHQNNKFFILPIVNNWKRIEITQKPKWYFFILLIPFVRIIVLYIINKQIAKDFKKNSMFALGLTFLAPIFYGILGMNKDAKRYI